jgi:hypothetical protein
MNAMQLRTLGFTAWMFLLPGLAGLLVSASMSAHYLENLPRMPVAEEMRMTPRSIHGVVVYETEEEDRRFSVTEYTSMGSFVVGLGLGLVYSRRRGMANAMGAEEDDYAEDAP